MSITTQERGILFSRDSWYLRSAARRKNKRFGRLVRSSKSAERRREATSPLSDLYNVTTANPARTITKTSKRSSRKMTNIEVPGPATVFTPANASATEKESAVTTIKANAH